MAIPIMAVMALAQAGYGMYKSQQQKKAAKKLKDSNFVPTAVEEAVQSSRLQANATSPEYQRGLEKLKQSTANTISSSKRVGGTAGQIQQSVADADAREKENIKDLSVAAAGTKAQARGELQNLLLTKGGYQKESRDAYNASKSALLGAAEQNQYNAITTGAQGLVSAFPGKTPTTNPATGPRAFNSNLSKGLSGKGVTDERASLTSKATAGKYSLNANAKYPGGGYQTKALKKNTYGLPDYSSMFANPYNF
jgi:hypothetical protein